MSHTLRLFDEKLSGVCGAYLLLLTHAAFVPFLMYNRSFSSIMFVFGRFINFAVSTFNTENDNLRSIVRVASVFAKHCFCKNMYSACRDF